MRLELPVWALVLFWFAYWVVSYWFISVPGALGLAVLGRYGPRWLGRLRWLSLGAAALLTTPFLLAVMFALRDGIHSSSVRAELLLALDHDEIVAGLPLPAGSKIWFEDAAHTAIESVELPRPANILGVAFNGRVWWNVTAKSWNGTLAADQSINGWPCRSGPVEIDGEGMPRSCELAAPYTLFGYELPTGTSLSYSSVIDTWSFFIPEDKGLAIKKLSTTAPGGVSLLLTKDGRLKAINSGDGRTIVVHGVPLSTMNINVTDKAVMGVLAEPVVVDGARQPAGTAIRIDLEADAVSLAPANWWLSE
jgi:hypothetical protein